MYLRDNGGGITRESLEFWNKNKNSIGKVTHVEVSAEGLYLEDRTGENGITYPVEYNFIAFGECGAILLSGCNCGYGGEGPNGTAKILAELGLTLEEARKAMYRKNIHYDVIRGEMIPPLE